MRPCLVFLLFLGLLLLVDSSLILHRHVQKERATAEAGVLRITVAALGLTDLSLATEARYTRHPAVSDPIAPFIDHPGCLEHFPTGSFWAKPAVND